MRLPILSGPIDSQIRVMEQYQLMNQLLYSSGLKLNGLTLSMRGSWDLTLNESIRVAVGRIEVVETISAIYWTFMKVSQFLKRQTLAR